MVRLVDRQDPAPCIDHGETDKAVDEQAPRPHEHPDPATEDVTTDPDVWADSRRDRAADRPQSRVYLAQEDTGADDSPAPVVVHGHRPQP